MANSTTNNENLTSSESTNLVARIVIPDNTSEGSHIMAENVGDIHIQSGNDDFSGDLSQTLSNILVFKDDLSNGNKTLITNANPNWMANPQAQLYLRLILNHCLLLDYH